MIATIENALLNVLTHYGLVIVFIGTALENSLFVGVFVPGVAILLAGGVLAAQGYYDLGYVIALAFIGGVIGDNVSYWLGRKGGRPFLKRFEELAGSRKRLAHVEQYYLEHGGKTVFVARFTAFVHTIAPLMAGVSRMTYPRFILLNASSGAIWSVSVPLLGFFFGRQLPDVTRLIKGFTWYSLALFSAALLVYIVYKAREHRREKADEETSGK